MIEAVQVLRSLLLGVSKLCSLLVTRQKDNTKVILGRFKYEGVDSIRFLKDRRRFLSNRAIQLYLRVQKTGEKIPNHVTNYQLPYKNTERHSYLTPYSIVGHIWHNLIFFIFEGLLILVTLLYILVK